MMKCAVAGLLAVVAGLAVVPTTQAASRSTDCEVRGKTLAANAVARIYTVRDPDTQGKHVLGCHFRTKRSWLLGREFDERAIAPVQLSGRYAAHAYTCHCRLNNWALQVGDLRTGRVLYRRAWEDSFGGQNEFAVTDLELKRTGAVAWIVRTQYREPGFPPTYGPVEYAVYKTDATGQGVLLDRHETIAQSSLALSGSTLYWMKNGQPQSAFLD